MASFAAGVDMFVGWACGRDWVRAVCGNVEAIDSMLFLSLEPPSAGSPELLHKPVILLILSSMKLLLRSTAVSGRRRITVQSYELQPRMVLGHSSALRGPEAGPRNGLQGKSRLVLLRSFTAPDGCNVVHRFCFWESGPDVVE